MEDEDEDEEEHNCGVTFGHKSTIWDFHVSLHTKVFAVLCTRYSFRVECSKVIASHSQP